ncbi:MAG: hypothetical protein H6Q19_839 [Bacteroidetes bacterium]|nr:hypothetical protein [Bacteroidota bacterium]
MSVVVFGGYLVFLAKNPLFKTATPVYVSFNGQGIEAAGRSDLSHPSLKNKKLKSPKDRKELDMKPDLKENPLMKLEQIVAGEAETFLDQTGGAGAAPAARKSISSSSGSAAGSGFMLVVASRSGGKSSSGSTQISAMSPSKVNLVTTPGIRSGAPDGTEGINDGGDPGGDPTKPPIPVGDGFYVLLILVAGYAFVHRKRINEK